MFDSANLSRDNISRDIRRSEIMLAHHGIVYYDIQHVIVLCYSISYGRVHIYMYVCTYIYI